VRGGVGSALSEEVTGEMDDARGAVAISVIVPVTERPARLSDLYEEYAAPLRALGRPYEFIFVAEPWFGKVTAPLEELAAQGEPITVLRVAQTMGETALLKLGAAHCRGPTVVTLPAYFRVEGPAVAELITRVDQGADLAVARRWPRRDSWINRLQSRVFHGLLSWLGFGRIHDVACGVRAMRREVLQEIGLYGDFVRFFPLLALRDGYDVVEVTAPQHALDRSARVYGLGTYLRRLIDLVGLVFLLRFTEKPLRFFGLLGSLSALAGVLVLAVITVQRFGGRGIADRPLLLLGVLLVVLGVQAIALGLVGEIIVYLHASRRAPYRVSKDRTDQA
jgi:hypothetical protein